MSTSREITIRPWGFYEILHNEPGYQIKRIHVEAGKRLSLQSHKHRSEHWYISQGQGIVEVEDTLQTLVPGDTVAIGKEAIHRIQAAENVSITFFEIQSGEYLGEDDIIRYEDDYGRA